MNCHKTIEKTHEVRYYIKALNYKNKEFVHTNVKWRKINETEIFKRSWNRFR